MTAKNTFWSKQKSHKTNETMICTRCNSIEIKQTSTIGMIFVGFVILIFIPAVRVFGFIGFGVFAVLVLSGYRPVMRDCLKCKAKGDKIVPVSDVKGKMLFETYYAHKVAEVEKVVEAKNKTNDDIKAQRTKKIAMKIAFYTIAGMVIFVTIGIISVPSKNTETTVNQSPIEVETPIIEEQKAVTEEVAEKEWQPSEDDIKFCNEAKKELCGLYKEFLSFRKDDAFRMVGFMDAQAIATFYDVNINKELPYNNWRKRVENGSAKYDNNKTSQRGCYGIWGLEHTAIYFSDLYTISLNWVDAEKDRNGNVVFTDSVAKFKKIDSGLSTGFSANLKTVCGQGLW